MQPSAAPKVPAIMWPWLDAIRAYWSDESQLFMLDIPGAPYVQVQGINPFLGSPDHGIGWFWAIRTSKQEILRQILRNEPSYELDFYLYEIAVDDITTTRAGLAKEIPPDHSNHFRIAEMFEPWKSSSFNQFLEGWLARGYLGAISQGTEGRFEEPRELVSDSIA
jgi:hypothetical protein